MADVNVLDLSEVTPGSGDSLILFDRATGVATSTRFETLKSAVTDDVNAAVAQHTSDIQGLTNNVATNAAAIAKCVTDVIEVTTPSFSSLPQTYTVTGITANHTLVQDGFALLSNPSAQGGDWTITPATNAVTISGTFIGSTPTTVKMTLGVKKSVTAS